MSCTPRANREVSATAAKTPVANARATSMIHPPSTDSPQYLALPESEHIAKDRERYDQAAQRNQLVKVRRVLWGNGVSPRRPARQSDIHGEPRNRTTP